REDGGLLQYGRRFGWIASRGADENHRRGVSAARRAEEVSRKRRMEGGSGRLRCPGHLGSRGRHRYGESERPDRRIHLRSKRLDVQPDVRRIEIHEAEEDVTLSMGFNARVVLAGGLNP